MFSYDNQSNCLTQVTMSVYGSLCPQWCSLTVSPHTQWINTFIEDFTRFRPRCSISTRHLLFISPMSRRWESEWLVWMASDSGWMCWTIESRAQLSMFVLVDAVTSHLTITSIIVYLVLLFIQAFLNILFTRLHFKFLSSLNVIIGCITFSTKKLIKEVLCIYSFHSNINIAIM